MLLRESFSLSDVFLPAPEVFSFMADLESVYWIHWFHVWTCSKVQTEPRGVKVGNISVSRVEGLEQWVQVPVDPGQEFYSTSEVQVPWLSFWMLLHVDVNVSFRPG